VLRSQQKVYGTKRIRGCTIIDDRSPVLRIPDREKLVDAVGLDKGQEGSSPTQDEGDATIFWTDDQGPVVMVWDGMLPGEQERDKTIISGEKDWIIWRVKSVKGEQGDQSGGSGNCQVITDFLEQFGTRLDDIQQKGPKAQRTSEDRSRGGFTRRRGWYLTNDIRTETCDRDMEIWTPKNDRGYSREDVEALWDAWWNDTQKDEFRVQLDDSVGAGSMGTGFVRLDRSKCGSGERIG
jgi:hypothetical protein